MGEAGGHRRLRRRVPSVQGPFSADVRTLVHSGAVWVQEEARCVATRRPSRSRSTCWRMVEVVDADHDVLSLRQLIPACTAPHAMD